MSLHGHERVCRHIKFNPIRLLEKLPVNKKNCNGNKMSLKQTLGKTWKLLLMLFYSVKVGEWDSGSWEWNFKTENAISGLSKLQTISISANLRDMLDFCPLAQAFNLRTAFRTQKNCQNDTFLKYLPRRAWKCAVRQKMSGSKIYIETDVF